LISGIDEVAGRMPEWLERRGMLDNTIVIYTTDNGFFLGERALSGKWLMHEESIRTPLIIRDPRLPAAMRGKQRGQMMLNIDLAPTILRAAEIDARSSMQGRDLAPLKQGQSPSWRRESYYSHLLYEELYDLRQDRLEERNLARAGGHDAQLKAIRERWKI
jgi:arylsulfatase A-like enzyme